MRVLAAASPNRNSPTLADFGHDTVVDHHHQGADGLRVPDAGHAAGDLGGAPHHRPHAAAVGTEPGRQVRAAADADGRHQARPDGGHRPARRGQAAVHDRAGDLDDPGVPQLRGDPVGPRGLDRRPLDAAAAHRPAGRGAADPGDELDGRVRDRAVGLLGQLAVLAARRAPVVGAGDQLRDRDGPVVRAGVPVRELAVDLADRGRAGERILVPPVRRHPARAFVVRDLAAAVVPDLHHHDGRRDEPAAVRPARGRG